MNLREAHRLLDPHLPAGPVGPESIRSAFAAAVLANHPDTMANAPSGLLVSMAQLKQARDVLLAHYGGRAPESERVCPVCRGSGWQAVGLRRYPCLKGCDPT